MTDQRIVDVEREHRRAKRKFYKLYKRFRRLFKDQLRRELWHLNGWKAEISTAAINLHRSNGATDTLVCVTLFPNKYKKKHSAVLGAGMTFSEPLSTFPRTIATQLMLIAP